MPSEMKLRPRLARLALAISGIALLLSGCLQAGDKQDFGGSGSSNSSTTTTTPDTKVPDGQTAYDLYYGMIAKLYNDNIANKPFTGGIVSITPSCTGGGTAAIVGTVSSTNNVTSVNLTYTMTGCKVTGLYYSPFTVSSGSITWFGTFNYVTKPFSESTVLNSTSFSYTGTGTSLGGANVSGSACSLFASTTTTGISGSLCSRASFTH